MDPSDLLTNWRGSCHLNTSKETLTNGGGGCPRVPGWLLGPERAAIFGVRYLVQGGPWEALSTSPSCHSPLHPWAWIQNTLLLRPVPGRLSYSCPFPEVMWQELVVVIAVTAVSVNVPWRGRDISRFHQLASLWHSVHQENETKGVSCMSRVLVLACRAVKTSTPRTELIVKRI